MLGMIFDMDGTLLDTQRIYVDAWNDLGQRLGIDRLGDLHVPNCCGMNESSWKQYLRDHFPSIDVETFHRDVKDYIQKNLVLRFKPGAMELIDFLKEHQVPIAVASGSSRALVEHNFSKLGILEQLDVIVGGDEIQNSKPAPDIFLLAAERLGIDPKHCVVVEDSSNGILAGHRAGMRCIGIPDIAPLRDETKALLLGAPATLDGAIPLLKPLL